MGILKWLLGSDEPKRSSARVPKREDRACQGDHPDVISLAPGRGFTFDVVGEAQWQENLSLICGGKCEDGYRQEVSAQLVFQSNSDDPNAVCVMIEARPVGWISAERAVDFRAAMTVLNPDGPAMTCKAKIVGGWDRGDGDEGHFGVKLSLSWPLKVRANRR